MSSQRTPTPWDATESPGGYRRKPCVVIRATTTGRRRVARVDTAEDAALIVRACNSHDALVAALENLARYHYDVDYGAEKDREAFLATDGNVGALEVLVDAARAALKAAKVQP